MGYALIESARLLALIDHLADQRVLIIGDVILDEYLYGRADRLSREAPIPVLEFTRRDLIPGGAANPAANVAQLGSRPTQIGVVGADEPAERLIRALSECRIDPAGMVTDATRPTTTKTRIMAQMGLRFPQQVARLDRIDRHPINAAIEHEAIGQVRRLAPGMGALIASDYLNGLLTEAIVVAIREAAREHGALLTADAQGELSKYGGFDLVKCNADEASIYVHRPLRADTDFADAGQAIVATLGLRGGMLITRGSEGLTLVEAGGTVTHFRAPHVEDVYDTVGAGDTALAVVTLALLAGANYPEAAALANFAAGFVVSKIGNYAPTREELRWAVQTWNIPH